MNKGGELGIGISIIHNTLQIYKISAYFFDTTIYNFDRDTETWDKI